MSKQKLYTGKKIPPPKQTSFGKKLRENRKMLRRFGGRKG